VDVDSLKDSASELTSSPDKPYPENPMLSATRLAHRHHDHRHPGGPAMLRALTTT
jgi:hypothetical protein